MQSLPQQYPPWTLRAWPPLLWQVGRPVPPGLRHLSTQVIHAGDTANGTLGQTLWACKGTSGALGLAWDWVQLPSGVLTMADPMAVLTNLQLVRDEGEPLTPHESARHYCTIVHALPWQRAVERAIHQAQAQIAISRDVSPPAATQLAA